MRLVASNVRYRISGLVIVRPVEIAPGSGEGIGMLHREVDVYFLIDITAS